MLNDKTKKNQLKNRQKKNLESNKLTYQTRDISHETKITINLQTTINYEVQSLINQVLKDETREKNIVIYIYKEHIIWLKWNYNIPAEI